jgi:hypothetical protein
VKPPHFNQKRRRKAEFIRPPNLLKAKVGSGGLSAEILDKAQALLEDNVIDFRPLADLYLASLMRGIEYARGVDGRGDTEEVISHMLYPAVQLKANGGMFHYQLVTAIADRLVQFLEVIVMPDIDAIEIVLAYHTTIRAVAMGGVTGDGGTHGAELIAALDDACHRYFEKYPENYNRTLDYTEAF